MDDSTTEWWIATIHEKDAEIERLKEELSNESSLRIEETQRLRAALEKYGMRYHYGCEDCWYSCPKHPDGCCNDAYDEDECNCGVDEHNAAVQATLSFNT